MPHVRQENRKLLFKGNYSQIFVSCFSNNCGNHGHITFLPAWANLMGCLLGLTKPTASEEGLLLRYFLMMQSSRNGYTFYSATGFEQQALHTCSQRIWNYSIWEKSNLIPILAVFESSALLLRIMENAPSRFCVTDKKVYEEEV